MTAEKNKIDVGIVINDPVFGQIMAEFFDMEGLTTATSEIPKLECGENQISSFLQRYNPKTILVEIAHPVDRNWRFFEELRNRLPDPTTPLLLISSDIDTLAKYSIPLNYPVLDMDSFNLDEWEQLVRERLPKNAKQYQS